MKIGYKMVMATCGASSLFSTAFLGDGILARRADSRRTDRFGGRM